MNTKWMMIMLIQWRMKKIKIMDLPYNNWIFAAKLHLTLYLLCCCIIYETEWMPQMQMMLEEWIYIRKLSCGFTPDYISTGSKWMMNVFWGRGEVEKYIEPVDSLYEIVNLSLTDLSSRNSIWTYVCVCAKKYTVC